MHKHVSARGLQALEDTTREDEERVVGGELPHRTICEGGCMAASERRNSPLACDSDQWL
jgi:hypothetical protein